MSTRNKSELLPKPSVLKIRFEKERPDIYEPIPNPTLKDFLSWPIYETADYRIAYLRDLNSLIETKLNNGGFDTKDIYQLSQLSMKLWIYLISGKNRQLLSQAHISSMWIIRCRIDYILHTLSSKDIIKTDLGNVKQFPILSKLGIIVSDDDVYSYKIGELIIALELVAEKMPEIKLFDEIPVYIRCLYISCAKYFVADTTDSKYYDDSEKYKRIYTHKNKTFYSVSQDFIRETERIFYEMERRIWMKNQFSYTTNEFLLDNDMPILDTLAKKLSEDVKPATQFLEPTIQKHIFQFMMAPGEKEKFIESNKLKKPEPYNVITFSRPEKAKWVVGLFEGDFFAPVYKVLNNFISQRIKKAVPEKKTNPIDYLLFGRREDDDDDEKGRLKEYHVDYIFELTCMIICNFIYHNNVKSKREFSSFVIFCDNISIPVHQNGFYNDQLPYIIQVFSNWGVWDPEIKKIHCGKTFVDCFLIWMKLIHKNPFDVREIHLMKKNGLDDLLVLISPIEKTEFQLFRQFLPENYTEGDMELEF